MLNKFIAIISVVACYSAVVIAAPQINGQQVGSEISHLAGQLGPTLGALTTVTSGGGISI